MYSLSMSFVIFIWTAMSVQLKSQEFQILRQKGCYMTIEGGGGFPSQDYIPILGSESMREIIEDYGLISINLCGILKDYSKIQECELTH